MDAAALTGQTLTGEVAIVTGGGTGLGLAIATSLVGAGAGVVITGRRVDLLDAAVTQVGRERCTAVPGDVLNAEDRKAAMRCAVDTFGRSATILVNNAGAHLKKPAVETSARELRAMLAVHVEAAFSMSTEVADPMLEQGHGSIVFIASMASLMGVPMVSAYTAAKSAVIGLTRALAAEWSPHGVRVNAIAPGWITSPMTSKALDNDPARKIKILSRTPMNKMGQPSDVGDAVAFLCSSSAAFITGTVLPVDGGASIGF